MPDRSEVKLTSAEQSLLLDEIPQVQAQLDHPESKRRYSELLAAVQDGELQGDDIATLERLLELGLETGRIRKVHTAHGEMTATRLYRKMPTARALQGQIDEVNDALTSLEGEAITSLDWRLRGPGVYELAVTTDRRRLRMVVGRDGVRIHEAST